MSSGTTQNAVLRIGVVVAVEGRRILVDVDRQKNLSHLFLNGRLISNVFVNSYVSIRKGFVRIIGRVEGERLEDAFRRETGGAQREPTNRNRRVITLALTGFIDEQGAFQGGTKELPLLGNEAFLLAPDELHSIHSLVTDGKLAISIASTYGDDLPLPLPVNGLINSHVAIFGNTGSGKSNTLASLYQEVVRTLREHDEEGYEKSHRFMLFDFNGEYSSAACITEHKTVYNLSTRLGTGDTIPISPDSFFDVDVLSILSDATEKTQKPFIARTLKLYRELRSKTAPNAYLQAILRRRVEASLTLPDKVRARLLLDYFRQILPEHDAEGEVVVIDRDLVWHSKQNEFVFKGQFLASQPNAIPQTTIHQHVAALEFGDDVLADMVTLLYVQLITDVLANRAQNEHIAPVIHRLERKKDEIAKIFSLSSESVWKSNFVVINLVDVSLEMRKTIPLLLAKRVYAEQKTAPVNSTLTLVIDEAHNILSTESFREAESWKDYRLETFEEIIKEGRKFGVFVTIASQRPNDISQTITSQAHNYFIHRLINERDLQTISMAVSYIDRVTEESIPTLPTGTCILSGVVTAVPVKLNIRPLPWFQRPKSTTRKFGGE